MKTLCIASAFSLTPGPRARDEGDFSGQQFREEKLRPQFLDARAQGVSLLVDLDGTEGFATSFLEEAFGGLAREFGADAVLAVLKLKSDEEPFLLEEVNRYISGAGRVAGP